MARRKITIRSNFPNSVQKGIIRQICEKRDCKNAFVSPFKRYGYSGAILLLLFFNKKANGLPYLLKVDIKEDIQKEYVAIKTMRDYVTDSRLEIDEEFSHNGRAGLIFLHRGTNQPQNAQDVLTLSNILYKNKRTYTVNRIKSIVNNVYESLEVAHRDAVSKPVNPSKYYKDYFRSHKSRKKIQSVLGKHANDGYFKFLNTYIYNPLKLMNELPSKVTVYEGHIHGDLHPDNIVLDRNKIPRLIDFAWAKQHKDILIDYVLLENSIRFMHFPQIANLEEQRFVDSCLLEENGYNAIFSHNFSNNNIQHLYFKLATLVKVIRKCARKNLAENFAIERYLFTQFVVLYGLLRFDTYNQYITTRALSMISKRLKNNGLSTLDAGV